MKNNYSFSQFMIAALISGCLCLSAFSQEELTPVELQPSEPELSSIVTDRPSFTASTETIAVGSLQVENGVTWQNDPNGLESVVLPETVLRTGITKSSEIQYWVPNYIYQQGDQSGQNASNFGDMRVAFKQKLPQLPGKIDAIIFPVLTIPTGANKVSAGSVDPTVNIIVSRSFGRFSLASQLGVIMTFARQNDQKVTLNPTLMASYAIKPNWGVYVEYASFNPIGNNNSVQIIDWGSNVIIGKRHQIDVRMGTGMNRNSPDLFIGAGYSFRIDNLFSGSAVSQ